MQYDFRFKNLDARNKRSVLDISAVKLRAGSKAIISRYDRKHHVFTLPANGTYQVKGSVGARGYSDKSGTLSYLWPLSCKRA
jgi:hypothetical protein